jgi:hypothetical protein
MMALPVGVYFGTTIAINQPPGSPVHREPRFPVFSYAMAVKPTRAQTPPPTPTRKDAKWPKTPWIWHPKPGYCTHEYMKTFLPALPFQQQASPPLRLTPIFFKPCNQ